MGVMNDTDASTLEISKYQNASSRRIAEEYKKKAAENYEEYIRLMIMACTALTFIKSKELGCYHPELELKINNMRCNVEVFRRYGDDEDDYGGYGLVAFAHASLMDAKEIFKMAGYLGLEISVSKFDSALMGDDLEGFQDD